MDAVQNFLTITNGLERSELLVAAYQEQQEARYRYARLAVAEAALALRAAYPTAVLAEVTVRQQDDGDESVVVEKLLNIYGQPIFDLERDELDDARAEDYLTAAREHGYVFRWARGSEVLRVDLLTGS